MLSTSTLEYASRSSRSRRGRTSRFATMFLAATAILPGVSALSFDIVGRPRAPAAAAMKRAVDMTGAFGNGSTMVSNDGDTIYSCNITLGGTEFEVLIDTGSSDLWVIGDVKQTKNLSIAASVSYAEGSAQGFINTATLNLDQYTVNDQAYINVVPSKDNPPTPGLIGLGPSSLSQVRSLVKSSAGDPPLDRIFRQNTSTPNFISVYLTRANDPSEAQTGQLTIGAVIPEYSDITKQTKLPALTDQFGVQHWETLLDANGIIGPDGKNLSTTTTISNPSAGATNQLHVVFDTGYTFPQVPQSVADAIYGRIPDAEFVTQTSSPGYWRVPCDYELNISFALGGVTFPIAPLDLTTPEGGTSKSCISTFQQISPEVANHKAFGAFDMILGMAFLRNAYLLIDFGDFVDGSSSSTADPYIQLLSLTTLADGHSDFVRERLGGVDTTASQAALLSEADAKHSPNVSNSADPDSLRSAYSNGSNGNDSDEPWYRRTWFIIAAAAAGGLILLGILAFAARRCATRRSRVRNESAFVPVLAGARAYAPLRDPAVGTGPGAAPSGAPPQYMREYRSSVDAGYAYGNGGSGYAEPRYQYGGRDV